MVHCDTEVQVECELGSNFKGGPESAFSRSQPYVGKSVGPDNTGYFWKCLSKEMGKATLDEVNFQLLLQPWLPAATFPHPDKDISGTITPQSTLPSLSCLDHSDRKASDTEGMEGDLRWRLHAIRTVLATPGLLTPKKASFHCVCCHPSTGVCPRFSEEDVGHAEAAWKEDSDLHSGWLWFRTCL